MKKAILFLAAAAALPLATPAFAHHSFAMFDVQKTQTIEGTVTKFEYTNPHSWMFIDAPDASGAVKHWGFEMNNLVGLRRGGWREKTVVPGDKVSIVMHPMRDGSTAGQLVSMTLPGNKVFDGRTIHDASQPNAALPTPAP
jgi:hypothetical protein